MSEFKFSEEDNNAVKWCEAKGYDTGRIRSVRYTSSKYGHIFCIAQTRLCAFGMVPDSQS